MKSVYLASSLLLASTCFGDSISTTVNANLPVGGSTTINKTVTVTESLTVPLDIFFLVDTTGSMGSAIDSVRTGFSSIVNAIAAFAPNTAFGLGQYKDAGDTPHYQELADLTTTTATVQTAINGLSAGGGGDTPEGQIFALQSLSTQTSWRAGSQRMVIWVGDAPGHTPSAGATEATAIAALNAANIDVFAASTTSGPGLDSACGGSDCTAGQATRIANQTGGQFLGNFNSSTISTAIQNAIVSAVSTYSLVTLQGNGVPVGVTISWAPVPLGSNAGSFDRSITRTFNFALTITGDTAGTYDFKVDALLDGRVIATETDHIVVGGDGSSVPEPATYSLIGAGLLAIALKAKAKRARG